MDSISFYAHPEILSTISFHIDNYKDSYLYQLRSDEEVYPRGDW